MGGTSVNQEIRRQVQKYQAREMGENSRLSTNLPITWERIIQRSEGVFKGIDDRLILLLCKLIMDPDSLHDSVTSVFPNIRFNQKDSSKLGTQEIKNVFVGCLETCSLGMEIYTVAELLSQAWERYQFNEMNITRALGYLGE